MLVYVKTSINKNLSKFNKKVLKFNIKDDMIGKSHKEITGKCFRNGGMI